jgi:hypothetical protein
MNEQELKSLAAKYNLDAAFIGQLYDKLTDKTTIDKALRMFVAGTLKFDVATGNDPIDIAAIRKDLAGNFQEVRKRTAEFMEKQKAIHEYYAGCEALSRKVNGKITDTVFIKDGKIVAFAHYEPKQGGIYMADNEVMPAFNWQPREALKRLRRIDRQLFKAVKNHATKEPLSLFIFDERTIRKDK